jgi:two-component system, OmpR family, sensor kinase
VRAQRTGDGGTLLIALSLADVSHTLHTLLAIELVVALAALAVAILLGAWFLGIGMRPLRAIEETAASVARGDLTQRVPADPGTEVGRLGMALNTMLQRIEGAFRERTESEERLRSFVADASHELRTPLTALRGNAAYIAKHGANAEVLADLENDAQRLARLLDDLLALAREDAAGPSSLELVRLDRLALALAGPRVAVTAPAPVTVRGDADALTRAIGNLIENALVHGPAGDLVTVEVGERDGRACVAVSDRGHGLPPDQAEHAFERFWRAPATDGPPGSGLGLAIVRATAERHGGGVSVSGATFALDLPAAD